MNWLYFTVVTLHVLAATVWIGGNLFLALVGAPVVRRVQPEELRSQLFEALGMRFRYVGWGAVGVLLLSGTLAMWQRGWLQADVVLNPGFWGTTAGSALGWKLGGVALMITLTALHDILLSPGRVAAMETSPQWARTRRRLVLLARAGTVVAVFVVAAAVRLARS